ncbi:bifunctional DNA primase/polymerase [Streptomyces sp. TG1A-8]|uniref:bifunctional DNA primase/polymerase n=1 Tax=Streptomyces sp. TG1A-8 TaxID=3051385 RepID=UPI00265BD1FC|nr:bifunctional DNA primase/polymerase [Streptomyces sp. TG1A-8]MDO0927205.1 bifunctional DNA primase/polymerase [Streptomyces sp. TG1A-8]
MGVEETIAGTEAARVPPRREVSLLETAVHYAGERHWDVVPGTWLQATDGVQRCSCADVFCLAPGAHPAHPDWASQATGSAAVARRMWQRRPTASILLPTGRAFDALSVPECAGFLALARMERMELALGPVTHTPDRRMQFFVLPGAAVKVRGLVRRLGWPVSLLHLAPLGDGDYVVAPPTRFGSRGVAQWARRPAPANRWLPDAEELMAPLAYACGRGR